MSTISAIEAPDLPTNWQHRAPQPFTEQAARLLGVLGVLAIAVVHLLDAGNTYHGTRYMFWLYMAIVCAAIPVSLLLLQWPSRHAWLLASGLAAGPFIGYVLSRTVGLPADGSDVGNWIDTLGMVSLFVEAAVMGLGATRWLSGGR